MKLQHSTQVQAPPDQVWTFLQDTRAVVACLPGAELTDDKGDDQYGGVLRVSIGPLKLNYNGQVDVTRRDADARCLELSAAARDRRGGGSVRADVRVSVTGAGDGASTLESTTDLQLTGRIAALGRGVQDVSNTMFADFSRRLAERVTGSEEEPAPGSGAAASEAPDVNDLSDASRPRVAAGQAAGERRAPVAGGEIKMSRLVLSVTRERLSALFLRWSEKLRP
ncbi:SRPBCC family protein [Nocardioides sp. LHG3406-4]|uniref:SRPBCC family protein n=1 Tax=Nocardioides sp. LHG3406-4 TaxID=2804575 RepID=UPI003CEDA606